MMRITISLPDDLALALRREARRRQAPVSAITRDALVERLGFASGESRKLDFSALGRSGHSNTARDMEQLLGTEWGAGARDR